MNKLENFEFEFDEVESCECIGQFEDEYVYDIEIDDDTHTFIGNEILIHNSLYVSFQPMMDSCNFTADGLEFILTLDRIFVKDMYNKWLDEYALKYKVKNIHDFELETINKSALHIEKKNYINNVVYEDSIFYENMSHIFPKGVEIVKSSTPAFARGNNQKGGVWDFIRYIFNNPNSLNSREVVALMKDLRKKFETSDIEDISFGCNANNYKKWVVDDQNNLVTKKGTPHHIKSVAFHNYLLNKNSELKTRYDLIKGGKVKWYFCKHSMNNRFAYMKSFHPYEIVEKEKVIIDYDEQFNASILSIVNRFARPIGLPEINKRLSILSSLFNTNTTNIINNRKVSDQIDEIKDKYEDFDDWDF